MEHLPYSFAKANGVLCLATERQGETAYQLLIRNDATFSAIAEARRHLGNVVLATSRLDHSAFEQKLAEVYSQTDQSVSEVADDIGQDVDLLRLVDELPPVEDLLDGEHDAPVIRMINALLTQAVRQQVSDIHIEPFERHSAVRFRRDGILRDILSPHRGLHNAMVSRIKIMAQLDIAEKRLPQDGRMGVRVAGRAIDVRVSTLPTNHGERVVMRLLEKNAGNFNLAALGMADDTLSQIDQIIRQPHGILLVTGPTGSGKTTTLYAALSRLDPTKQNIMTVEDPVEYDLPGIGQVQVNQKADMTFARALRAILRQDPDVLMIGEIRDLETAQIAVQASLTGHLVLATLHTNDSTSAVTRLVDMGVEPFLLSSSLLGVLAQRLVRKLCPHCRTAVPENTGVVSYRASGCDLCAQSGYEGRRGIYELLTIDDEIRTLIHNGAPEQTLRQHATDTNKMRLLREDGQRWLISGETSNEELIRVTRD